MSRPHSPCIAVCTTLYDEFCKGCGRTYLEVAQWEQMTELERETAWIRIESEATSWRFNKYKERADAQRGVPLESLLPTRAERRD